MVEFTFASNIFTKFFIFRIDKKVHPFYNVYQDVEEKSKKSFNQYRDISVGERNEREAFEHGLGVIASRSKYLG